MMRILDSLWNSFTDTIFLKEDSNLEKQVEELKNIRDSLEDKATIDKDIRLLEFGIKGENEIAYELKNANLGLYVLRDITIEYEEAKAQIDFVVISKGFIYLIECKNLFGNIWIDNQGQFHREYELNNRKIKEAIYSPYTQAVRHKEILKKRWTSKHNKLEQLLYGKQFDNSWYKPLVVMANSKGILNMKYAPKEVKNHTIRVDKLISYMKKDLEQYDKDLRMAKKRMLDAANSFLEANIDEYHSIANKYKDKIEEPSPIIQEKIENKQNIDLENKLKEFRKQKSQSMNIPAYYVFTDKELENMIERKPRDMETLKDILPPIKMEVHGEEIIKIINDYS